MELSKKDIDFLVSILKKYIDTSLATITNKGRLKVHHFEEQYMRTINGGLPLDQSLFRTYLQTCGKVNIWIDFDKTGELPTDGDQDVLYFLWVDGSYVMYIYTDTYVLITNYAEDIADLEENKVDKTTDILYADLLALIANDELIPSSSYRITDYTTTTVQIDTASAGRNFDIIVTALSTNKLSENAKCVKKDGDTYFTNAKLEAWDIKYCIDNDTSRFAWADAVSGKGVIYYMKDEWNNECPYDFKNIQFKRYPIISMSDGSTDLVFDVDNQKMKYALKDSGDNIYPTGAVIDENNASYYFTFNAILQDSETYDIYDASVIQNGIKNDEGGDFIVQNNKINETHTSFDNPYDHGQLLKFNNIVINNVINSLVYTELSYGCYSNTFGNYCYSNTFGDGCNSNTFGNYCYSNTFGNNCFSNTFGDNCFSNTFGDNCSYNNFYTGTSGTTKKDYISYIVLEDGVSRNNFYSTLTTSGRSFLKRIRIKGLEHTTQTNIQITLSGVNTKYEWVICYTSDGELKQYCPDDLLTNNNTYKIENTIVSTWSASTAYTDFGYQSRIDIADLSESDFVNVVFGVNDAVSGNYAPAIEQYEGYILVFSKVNTAITIPTIEITKIDL